MQERPVGEEVDDDDAAYLYGGVKRPAEGKAQYGELQAEVRQDIDEGQEAEQPFCPPQCPRRGAAGMARFAEDQAQG